ncbi:MAG: hypothetical protein A3G86_04075 [Gammaproteobacteria bacterium RIFCSPLOWO2_12_FULL_42_18]|nr:MAG: hypothetical protein A3G86_04075 [Gammaproteobacteria bacterium RIFCSPLOWO2_12_FULL_42_18]
MVLFVLSSLFGYCLSLKKFLKMPLEQVTFLIISITILVLYGLAYVGTLKIGTMIFILVGLILLLTHLSQLKNITTSQIITFSFLTLFLLSAYFIHLTQWDEFAQWGPHIKLMYWHHGFIQASDVTTHKAYPPGGTLFYYLFLRLTHFSEGMAYVAQCLLTIAPIAILFSDYPANAWRRVIIFYVVTIILLLSLGIKIGPVGTLYMDGVTGIFVGMCLVFYFSSKKTARDILLLLPTVMALTLFKVKLFPFVLMIACIIFLDQWCFERTSFLKKFSCIVALPIASLLVSSTWHHYLNHIQVKREWKMHPSFSHLSGTQHAIIHNFFHALTPTVLFLVLIVFFTILIYQYTTEKKRLVLTQSILCACFVLYIAGLLLMYLFSFGEYEAVHHLSLNRYLHIIEIAWLLVTLYFFFQCLKSVAIFSDIVEKKIIIALCVAIFVYLFFYGLHQHQLQKEHRGAIYLREPIAAVAKQVNIWTPTNAKIFSIWQSGTGLEHAILAYELLPRVSNMGCVSFGKPESAGDVWTCPVNNEQLKIMLSHFDYLLLAYSNSALFQQYQAVLPNLRQQKPLLTYQICKRNSFDSFNSKNCQLMTERAYLFKIIVQNKNIYFKNIGATHASL